MLAPIGVVVPLLPGDDRAVQENADRAQGDRKALDDFLEAYRLAPGQILKRVPPPRPEGVRTWWKQKYPTHDNRPDEFGALVFRWRDPDQLDNWGGTTGEGFSSARSSSISRRKSTSPRSTATAICWRRGSPATGSIGMAWKPSGRSTHSR